MRRIQTITLALVLWCGFANGADDFVEKLLAGMSVREKIGQTFNISINDLPLHDENGLREFLVKYPVGSLFCGRDIANKYNGEIRLADGISRAQRASKIPLSIAGDPVGFVPEASPKFQALVSADDEKLAYDLGAVWAKAAIEKGFNWALAPCMDVNYNWMNPIMGSRCGGDDPVRIATISVALIRGMQDHGLSATGKHFPGDGVDFRDQHLCPSINSLSREQWMAGFGIIYRKAFAAGVHTVMTGHISLPFADPSPDGETVPLPATLSERITTGLLRNELGFDGVVVSDALIMSGFVRYRPEEWRLVECFRTGTDVMLWPPLEYFDWMETAISKGHVPMSRLDEAVRRILVMKERQGLFRGIKGTATKDPSTAPDVLAVARSVAEKSTVLARNRLGLIPFQAARTKRVLLWIASSNGKATASDYSALKKAFESRGATVVFRKNGNCLDLRKLELSGERFDQVLFLYADMMHAVNNTIRPIAGAGECLWTLNYTECHHPIVVSFGSPYLLWENPSLDELVNVVSGFSDVAQETLVRQLYGEIPFVGKSAVKLTEIPLGVQELRK